MKVFKHFQNRPFLNVDDFELKSVKTIIFKKNIDLSLTCWREFIYRAWSKKRSITWGNHKEYGLVKVEGGGKWGRGRGGRTWRLKSFWCPIVSADMTNIGSSHPPIKCPPPPTEVLEPYFVLLCSGWHIPLQCELLWVSHAYGLPVHM